MFRCPYHVGHNYIMGNTTTISDKPQLVLNLQWFVYLPWKGSKSCNNIRFISICKYGVNGEWEVKPMEQGNMLTA